MSIRPVDFGGMIQRTDDVGVIKHQEEQKPVVDQSNIMVSLSKEGEEKLHQVQDRNHNEKLKNDSEGQGGGAGYQNSSKEKKQKKEDQSKVVRKSFDGGFDIKI